MATKQKQDTLEDRVARLERFDDQSKHRLLECERLLRVLGRDYENKYMNEIQLRKAAKKANHFSNAMRELRANIRKYGNEFDVSPHLSDPEKDYEGF